MIRTATEIDPLTIPWDALREVTGEMPHVLADLTIAQLAETPDPVVTPAALQTPARTFLPASMAPRSVQEADRKTLLGLTNDDPLDLDARSTAARWYEGLRDIHIADERRDIRRRLQTGADPRAVAAASFQELFEELDLLPKPQSVPEEIEQPAPRVSVLKSIAKALARRRERNNESQRTIAKRDKREARRLKLAYID